MPNYTYRKCLCEYIQDDSLIERNVPMDERDRQKCNFCGASLTRKLTFTGLTWAPTAGGMR